MVQTFAFYTKNSPRFTPNFEVHPWYLKNKTGTKFTTSSVKKDTYVTTMSNTVDGRQLYCVVTDQYGNTATTTTVTLYKSIVLAIITEPEDVLVENGQKAISTVLAEGEELTYQLYVKNRMGTNFSKSSIKTDTYSVTMSDAVDGSQVYCVVTDKYGNTVQTDTATLYKYGLSIVTQPYDVSVEIGKKAAVSVAARGEGLTYQWYVKNRTATKFSKSSIVAETYSVTMSDTVDGRQAYCVITDANGNTVQTNTVTLSKK